MSQPELIIISAPSGAGKSTLVKALLAANPKIELSVSACTRPPRAGEVDGEHYHFLTVEEFKKRIEAGEFIEWEMVYEGKYYGTLRSEIQSILAKGHIPILDIDVAGAINVMEIYAGAYTSIFIMPPSIAELKNRLLQRGSETDETLQERVDKAAQEIALKDQFQHIVVNDDLQTAISELKQLVLGA